jgi:predicted TIM-barrel fold metal-dependent hydrolase
MVQIMNSTLLRGAWDCHTHIYGPWEQFPLPSDAAYRPNAAPFDDLLERHAAMGIDHGVLVQAAPYGNDHAAILAAVARSQGRYRAVGLIDANTTDEQLQALHDGGMRGIRFNLMGHLPGNRDPDELRRLAERIQPWGWHVLLHGEMHSLLPVLDAWKTLSTPLVIDHMARLDLTQAVDEHELQRLEQHLRQPHRWIKVSGIDRALQGAPAPWDRGRQWLQRFLQCAPQRTIWGSDWPHPNIKGDVPDDHALLDFLLQTLQEPGLQKAVLIDNPAALYA